MRIAYLKDRLRLIDIVGVREDEIRFQLDPLAEHLAALETVDRNDGDEAAWKRLVGELEGRITDAAGFVEALWDSVRIRSDKRIPQFVSPALEKMVVMDRPAQ